MSGTRRELTPEERAEGERLAAETRAAMRQAEQEGRPAPAPSRHLRQAWSVPLGRTADGARQPAPAADPAPEASESSAHGEQS